MELQPARGRPQQHALRGHVHAHLRVMPSEVLMDALCLGTQLAPFRLLQRRSWHQKAVAPLALELLWPAS